MRNLDSMADMEWVLRPRGTNAVTHFQDGFHNAASSVCSANDASSSAPSSGGDSGGSGGSTGGE